jgi:hypothetical protein
VIRVHLNIHSKLILWRDLGGLSSISKELLDKASDITTGNWNVLDRGSNDITLGLEVSIEEGASARLRTTGIVSGSQLVLLTVKVQDSLRVTPSPESMTTPVKVLSATFDEVHDAARAKTAWTAMYLSIVSISPPRVLSENPQSLDIETLKHDFGSVFPVLWRVERWFSLLDVSFYPTKTGNSLQAGRSGPLARHGDT